MATSTFAASSVIYDALPSVDPTTSYPSQPFQAQQTSEFGDYIHLGGSSRILDNVTVTMVTWARYSEYVSNSAYNATNWTHPITLNVYNNHLDVNGVPDQKIATVLQTITIPWRPEGNSSCRDTGYGAGFAWINSKGVCVNGLAFNAVFDLSSLHVTLPDDIIVSVAFNTQTYGTTPIGTNGPYNSLNVAVPPDQVVSVGSDQNTDAVYWNTLTDIYPGIFHEYTGWTPNGTVAMQVRANAPVVVVGPPNNKDQCKKDLWKTFNNPVFKNQGDCVSYVQSNINAEGNRKDNPLTAKTFTAPDSLYYNGLTAASGLYGTGAISFTWDLGTGVVTSGYWNEVVPPTTGTVYNNVVVSGTVNSIGGVHLDFYRAADNYSFSLDGILSGNVLTGTAAGPYLFTATGI